MSGERLRDHLHVPHQNRRVHRVPASNALTHHTQCHIKKWRICVLRVKCVVVFVRQIQSRQDARAVSLLPFKYSQDRCTIESQDQVSTCDAKKRGSRIGLTTFLTSMQHESRKGPTIHSCDKHEPQCSTTATPHLVSRMLCLTRGLCESKCESVNAGRRRMEKRSCSQASTSSARLIFLCTMLKRSAGSAAADTRSRFCKHAQTVQDPGTLSNALLSLVHVM